MDLYEYGSLLSEKMFGNDVALLRSMIKEGKRRKRKREDEEESFFNGGF
jgi:hypothetical protein